MPLKNISVVLTADAHLLSAGLKTASGDVRSFGNDVRTASVESTQSTARIGTAVTGLGLGLLAVAGASAYAAIQFEQSLRNVTTISDYVDKHFQETADRLVKLSGTLPQSANELAQGLYDVASSGFAGASGMTVLEQAAKAASAGLSTTAVAGRAITGVLNAYGLGANKAREVSDILFQTVNLGVVTFDELAQNIGDVIGVAASAHVPIRDVGTAIATITLAGIPAAEATTRLNRVVQSFIKPSDALGRVIHQLGYESGSAALKQDGLQKVMTRVKEATGGSLEAFSQLFPDIRALGGALALTAADGRNWQRVAEQMGTSTKGVGATQRALEQQQKSLGFQLEILKNQVTNAGIALGTTLLPALKLIVGAAGHMLQIFLDLPSPVKTGLAAFISLAGIFLVLAGGAILLSTKLATMRASLELMGPAGARAATAMTFLGASFKLLGGLGLIAFGFSQIGHGVEGTITGVIALTVAVGLLRSALPAVETGLLRLGLGLSSIAGGSGVPTIISGLVNSVGRLGQVLPTLALSGAVLSQTFDDIGQGGVKAALGVTSMIATGAQLGFVFGGPVGAAIGGAVGLVGALTQGLISGGESVEAYEAKIAKLSGTIDGLAQKQALKVFVDALGETDKLKLFAGDIKGVTNEITTLATKSPAAARRIADGLRDMNARGDLSLTSRDFTELNHAIDKGTTAFVHNSHAADKARESNAQLTQKNKDLGQSTKELASFTDDAVAAAKAAQDAYDKAIKAIADTATSNLPTASKAFDDAAAAAAHFGLALDPGFLLQRLQEALASEAQFGSNLATIMNSGFTSLAQLVAQKGPEAGGQIAQAIADGIRNGDPTVAAALNLSAAQVDAQGQVLYDTFINEWGPKIKAGSEGAFAFLEPSIRAAMGLAPKAVTDAGPALDLSFLNTFQTAGEAAGLGIQVVPRSMKQAMDDSVAAVFAAGGPLQASSVGTGLAAAFGFSQGISPIPGDTTKTAQDAATALGQQAAPMGTQGQAVGQSASDKLGEAAASMSDKVDTAVGDAVITLSISGLQLSIVAGTVGVAIGSSFSTGIATGIATGSGAVKAAAAKVVQDAEASANEAAGAHSPSRLFKKVGRDIGLGMALGITSTSDIVARATAGLVNVPSAPAGGSVGTMRPSRGWDHGAGSGSAAGGVVINAPFTVQGDVHGVDDLDRHLQAWTDKRDRATTIALKRDRSAV